MLGYAFGDGVFELVDAFSCDGGDGEEGEFAAGGHGLELFELGGVGGVELGGDDEGGFRGDGGVEGAQFVEDDAVVFYGVGGFYGGGGRVCFRVDGLGFAIACKRRSPFRG